MPKQSRRNFSSGDNSKKKLEKQSSSRNKHSHSLDHTLMGSSHYQAYLEKKKQEKSGVQSSTRLQQLRRREGVSTSERHSEREGVRSFDFRSMNAMDAMNPMNALKEIKDAEKQGDIIGAYLIAKDAKNHYEANMLARDHNITGHEYLDIIHFHGNDLIEDYKECLKSRFQEGATASKLGFHGFDERVVADIGAKDGRYVSFFKALGARDVYGIDPDTTNINIAVEKGLLSSERAIPTKLEEIPTDLKGKFDVAAVLNLSPLLARDESFIRSLRDVLPPHGQVVMTVVETETYQNVLPLMHKHFNVRSQQLWEARPQGVHAYLIVADKN